MISKKEIKSFLEVITPILIVPKGYSANIGLSKRFILFQLVNKIVQKIDNDPYLNFLSILKHYKVLNKYLHGTIAELHRDRKATYVKNFFGDSTLYDLIVANIEYVYEKNKSLNLTISRSGVMIYDNYKPNGFNVLLLTIHSGTWMPKDIEAKQSISSKARSLEEDVDTDKIFCPLVLDYGGIWIDTKLSRYACDCNRSQERAIYENNSEKWLKQIWKEPLSPEQRKRLLKYHTEFYFTLSQLIKAYNFTIIFDGHSMGDRDHRPEVSFGTRYIPKFYMPIVHNMKKLLISLGYDARLDTPYKGGHILKWLHERFPELFISSMEVNKALYVNNNVVKSAPKKIKKLSKDIKKSMQFD